VEFIQGFFNDSLPPILGSVSQAAPVKPPPGAPTLALLRIDADAYDGVLDALQAGYARLSPGGFVLIDDWHLSGARAAVHEFRSQWNVTSPILPTPSDYAYTCAASITGLGKCAGGDVRGGEKLLYLYNKHLVTSVGQHAAYWRKAAGEKL